MKRFSLLLLFCLLYVVDLSAQKDHSWSFSNEAGNKLYVLDISELPHRLDTTFLKNHLPIESFLGQNPHWIPVISDVKRISKKEYHIEYTWSPILYIQIHTD